MLLSPGEKIPPSINPTSTPENTQQPVVKCPRCDSPNTKFCYYNNYSLSQPRHFCKTCRRYWTKGGALRNVPVGGGCRKNKKLKTGSFISPSSRISATSCLIDDHLMNTRHDNNKDNDNDNNNNQMGTSEFGFSGLRFLHSVVSPAIDFQLGTSSFSRATTTTQNSLFHQFSSFPELSQTNNSGVISAGGIDLASGSSFQYPSSTTAKQHGDGNFNGNYNISLVSSIKSLSSMNQELHWKLQQQRIAMLYDNSTKKQNTDSTNGVAVAAAMVERPLQPIMFQSLEMTTTNEGSSSLRKDAPTEWFFDGSFAPGPVATTPTNSGGNGSNENGDGGDGGGSGGGRGGFGGVQLWSDLPQFTGLPLN